MKCMILPRAAETFTLPAQSAHSYRVEVINMDSHTLELEFTSNHQTSWLRSNIYPGKCAIINLKHVNISGCALNLQGIKVEWTKEGLLVVPSVMQVSEWSIIHEYDPDFGKLLQCYETLFDSDSSDEMTHKQDGISASQEATQQMQQEEEDNELLGHLMRAREKKSTLKSLKKRLIDGLVSVELNRLIQLYSKYFDQ